MTCINLAWRTHVFKADRAVIVFFKGCQGNCLHILFGLEQIDEEVLVIINVLYCLLSIGGALGEVFAEFVVASKEHIKLRVRGHIVDVFTNLLHDFVCNFIVVAFDGGP